MTDRLPIKMLHDRVLVRMSREDGERRSSGGIVIPATAQVAKRLIWAEVLASGQVQMLVERIAGSHSAVVGLPLVETLALLREAGYRLPWEQQ